LKKFVLTVVARLFEILPAAALVTIVAAATGCSPAPGPDPGPPNIVLLLADDLGYPYHGFTGSEIVATPSLDLLARQGTVFTHGFTSASTCRPSQLTLLTGLHPAQWAASVDARPTRKNRRQDHGWIADFETLPRALRSRGYATFQAGKLWEGRTFEQVGFTHGTKDPIEGAPSRTALRGGSGLSVGRTTMKPVFDFIDAHKEGPFFVWFAPSLPHTPHDADARFEALYQAEGISSTARAYYANVTRFDSVAGELLAHLDAAGLRESTLVVYLSDNGWDQAADESQPSPRGGERGKFSIHDQGFRTPVIFRWPGRIEAGEARDDLVSAADLFPTLLGLAGINAPDGRMGVDLRFTLLEGTPSPREAVIGGVDFLRGADGSVSQERAWFVRRKNVRYVRYETSGREALYDLRRDPDERHDNAANEPTRTRELRALLDAWTAQVVQPVDDSEALSMERYRAEAQLYDPSKSAR
jgi:arylsulfatase A-like enzyme